MKQKKFIWYILATSLLLLLSGCNGQSPAVEEIAFTEVFQVESFNTESSMGFDEIQTVEQSVTESDEQYAEIVMVGDVLLHTRVSDSGKMEDGSYNYDHLFSHVKEKIQDADLALVNQEVILGGTALGLSGYPAFNGAFEVGDSLVDAGFDVILHATNHALDKGKRGLYQCVSFWRDKYPEIEIVGIYDNEAESQQICVEEVNGIKIAILNYTYGTNGIPLPKDAPFVVNLWEEQRIIRDVTTAKQLADFVIVCPHWGTEYIHTASKSQKTQAQFLADLGVDLIIGTHPHVIEPVEWLTGKDGNQTLCYYSIGNYINATSGTGKNTADRMLGAMADVKIAKIDEQVEIVSYDAKPLISHLIEGRGQMTTYFIEDYTDDLSMANQIRKQDASFSLEYCKNICREVFPDLYTE